MNETWTGTIAAELLSLLGTGRTAGRISGLDMSEAYGIAARIRALREARGERALGRKIGFTNTTIWERYGVDGPMWNFVYDSTLRTHDANLEGKVTFSLAGLPEPRIEPEIVLRLGRAPQPGMDEAAMLGCVDDVAQGFEVVQSVYPGWKMTCPEAAAAFGLHGALLVGPWRDITAERAAWEEMLTQFSVTLKRDNEVRDRGHAQNVLGGPLSALRFLVEEISRHPGAEPLIAGEIVATGTLTDAQPISPGETWTAEFDGVPLEGPVLRFIA